MITAFPEAVVPDSISEITARHTYGTWRRQRGRKPMHVTRAKGVWFWDSDGKKYLDLSAQLMCVNLGHQNEAVAEAICRQAKELAFIGPSHTCDIRAHYSRIFEIEPKQREQEAENSRFHFITTP